MLESQKIYLSYYSKSSLFRISPDKKLEANTNPYSQPDFFSTFKLVNSTFSIVFTSASIFNRCSPKISYQSLSKLHLFGKEQTSKNNERYLQARNVKLTMFFSLSSLLRLIDLYDLFFSWFNLIQIIRRYYNTQTLASSKHIFIYREYRGLNHFAGSNKNSKNFSGSLFRNMFLKPLCFLE